MIYNWRILLAMLAILSVSLACQAPLRTAETPTNQSPPQAPAVTPDQSTAEGTANTPVSVEQSLEQVAGWPGYIPDEIPPLPGTIRKVMGGEGAGRVRIFYQGMTKQEIDAYLRLLEKRGFLLEYRVYVDESKPDNSEERMRKGDYDDVLITKGEYSMRLDYGGGDIVYDIDTYAFAGSIPTSTGASWPTELQGKIFPPERCPIEQIFPGTPAGYLVLCQPADEQVASDYISALLSAGFSPEVLSATSNTGYVKDGWAVAVSQHSTAIIQVQILPMEDAPALAWPAQFMNVVPPPEGCTINNVFQLKENEAIISCEAQDEQVVPDYLALLESAGFRQSDRMETTEGVLVGVTMEKAGYKVQLFLSAVEAKFVTIKITE